MASRDSLRAAVLAWYASEAPVYPWRRTEADPYAVWVSEVMLQQTQAARVVEAFPRFLAAFPTVETLARSSRAKVLRAWAGLGYHRRAVALHETAGIVMREHGGRIPSEPSILLTLPGVGPYTAAAVASIAYRVPIAAVDTNVHKVMARVDHGVERDQLSLADATVSAEAWLFATRPGDWNQALMNLGHDVCRTSPRCEVCPLAPGCRFRRRGAAGRPSGHRKPAFAGSTRQLRGAVVAALRIHDRMTLAALARHTGREVDAVCGAVVGLERDGVVAATPAARAGRPRGTVRLPPEPAT